MSQTTLIHLARELDALNHADDVKVRSKLIETIHNALGERYAEFFRLIKELVGRHHKAPAMAAICRMGAQDIPAEMPNPPESPPDPRWTKFLSGLAALSKETGIGIAACGCCRSPWLTNVTTFDGYTVDRNGEGLTMVIGGVPALGESQHG